MGKISIDVSSVLSEEKVKQMVKSAMAKAVESALEDWQPNGSEQPNEIEQLTLGELIDKVAGASPTQPDGDDKRVYFDFCNFYPHDIDSWRGSYEQLALGYRDWYEGPTHPQTVRDFLAMLNKAVGEVFVGYKGGEYLMTRDTPVWVARHGEVGSTVVSGAIDTGHALIIQTSYLDW
jgi:hypothetical protein